MGFNLQMQIVNNVQRSSGLQNIVLPNIYYKLTNLH